MIYHFSYRLRVVLAERAKGKAFAELALALGLQPASLKNFLYGRKVPSGEILARIATICPDANIHWLLTGAAAPPVPSATAYLAAVAISDATTKARQRQEKAQARSAK